MELFYAAPHQIDRQAARVFLDGDEFHHLVRVLRKRKDEQIAVTDGCGAHFDVRIRRIGKRALEGDITAERQVGRSGTRLTVALSMLKVPHRFEFFLEKATELGVDSVIPLITARTVVRAPTDEQRAKRLDRWRSIIRSAARQSGRYYLPDVVEPQSLQTVLSLDAYQCRLIAYERASSSMPLERCIGVHTLVVIGGEGGFALDEIAFAEQAGFCPLSFGCSILRAETAGIFAVSLIRAQLLQKPKEEWF